MRVQFGPLHFKDILVAVKSFITDYAQTRSLDDAIKTAFEQLPYRIFGLTAQEISQIESGLIPVVVKQKVADNLVSSETVLNKVKQQLQNIPTVASRFESFINQIVKPQFITPELSRALVATKNFAQNNKDLLNNCGAKVALLIEKIQSYLSKNLKINQVNQASVQEIVALLIKLAQLIKPDVEQVMGELKKADKNQINNLLNDYKAIDFSRVNMAGIQNDITSFVNKNF